MNPPRTVTLALTGASGMPYGLRLLECLLQAKVQVYLLTSSAAHIVAKQELGLTLPARAAELESFLGQRYHAQPGQLRAFGREEWFAPVASGSNPADAMVVCPCTMGTLAAIAQGLADNLIERAADVAIKEQAQTHPGTARNALLRIASGKHAEAGPARRGHPAAQSRLLSPSSEY